MNKTSADLSPLYEIRDSCNRNFLSFQLWPSYFNRRFAEFLSYKELFPNAHLGKVLELGSGIGYQSAFLSTMATEVIATDLPEEKAETHSPGMKIANDLLNNLNVKNVRFIPCSAEDLPFENASFDFVYASHVIEHIPLMGKSLNEIYRVLKPGGIFFCVVPASFDKFYAFINYYIYLFSRIPFAIINKFRKVKSNHAVTEKMDKTDKSINSFKKYFPFPPPHGASPDFLTEFKEWTPAKWRKNLMNAAKFELIEQRTTQYFPFLPMFGFLLPTFGTFLHSITRKFERSTGKLMLFQYFGINSVLILRKSKTDTF